jgi:hypothetical protein
MSAITNEMVHISYEIGKKVFLGEISQKKGLYILNFEYKMDKGSAQDYIHNY